MKAQNYVSPKEIPLDDIETILEVAEMYDDAGPCGEGWQSSQLLSACYAVREWLERLRGDR